MRRSSLNRNTVISSLSVFLLILPILAPGLISQEIIPTPLTSAIFPSPDPFSLDARAAQTCIDLLRLEGFLLIQSDTDTSPEILPVREVYAWFLNFNNDMPPGHRRRYDIYVNGEPLDWEHSYIEWDGRMTKLQILFTYRNQYPTAPFRLYDGQF